MLNAKPHIRIFTRPSRSARPPMTTMKMPENSAVIDTAMFMTFVRDVEIGRHRRRDVEGGLGEQPEGQHTENDAEEQPVVAAVIGRLFEPSSRFLASWAARSRQIYAGARYAESLRCSSSALASPIPGRPATTTRT